MTAKLSRKRKSEEQEPNDLINVETAQASQWALMTQSRRETSVRKDKGIVKDLEVAVGRQEK